MTIINNDFDSIEYNSVYPYEQEYQAWINALEADYQNECKHRAGVTVTSKTKINLVSEELSPYSTINS